jgi:transposase
MKKKYAISKNKEQKMAVAYSYDLRERAINLVKEGKGVEFVAELLKIGKSTIRRWLTNLKRGIDLRPRKNWQKGHSHKITDLKAFKEFVDNNAGLTQKQMAEKWGNVGRMTIARALVKIEYTKKKDFWI